MCTTKFFSLSMSSFSKSIMVICQHDISLDAVLPFSSAVLQIDNVCWPGCYQLRNSILFVTLPYSSNFAHCLIGLFTTIKCLHVYLIGKLDLILPFNCTYVLLCRVLTSLCIFLICSSSVTNFLMEILTLLADLLSNLLLFSR